MPQTSCPTCNASLESGARFCGACGAQLQGGGQVPHKAHQSTPASPNVVPSRPGGVPFAASNSAAATLDRKNSQPPDPLLGQTLNNRFLVETKLGEGGFGAVYRGVQIATSRKVALKVLHPEMSRDPHVVMRFKREGQVLCQLRDAHTITTYDFDTTPDGMLYIAMELLEGRSLHDVFHREAPIAWQRMLQILAEMCSSLEEAHRQGIVHRDLKPENIYLEKRSGDPEFVKVLDFGIAKVVRGEGGTGPAGPNLTATGQTLGTLEYMSPEQLMGKELDGRSDVYAMGVVAYELLTKQLPFPDANGPAALIAAQLKKVPPPPSAIRRASAASETLPEEVDELVLRMLQKDKNQRHGSVAELRMEIERILSLFTGQVTEPFSSSQFKRGRSHGAAKGDPEKELSTAELPPSSTFAAIRMTTQKPVWLWVVVAVLVVAAISVAVIMMSS